MKRLLALLALLSGTAQAAGPIIWYGSNSQDLTSAGLITPALTLPEGGLVAATDLVVLQAPAAGVTTWTLTLPPDNGTAGQCLETDGNGVTVWGDDSFTLPINIIESFDPLNTSSTRFYLQSNLTPSIPSASANITEFSLVMDAANNEALGDLKLIGGSLNATGDDNVNSMTGGFIGLTFGNGTDASTLSNSLGFGTSFYLHANSTASNNTIGHSVDIGSDVGSTITDSYAYTGNFNVQGATTGGLHGISIGGGSADIGTNLDAFNFSVNVTGDVDGSINGVSVGSNVSGEVGNYSKWFSASGNIGETNGGSAFSNVLNITTNNGGFNGFEDSINIGTTDSYTSLNAHPNIATSTNQSYGISMGPGITTTNGYVGLQLGGTVTTSTANVIAIDDGIHVDTTTTGYLSVNLHPQVDAMTESFTGIQIQPTAVGDGGAGDRAVGLQISMNGATNFEEVKAISADGIVTAAVSVPIASAGNPTPVHAFNTGFFAPDGSTITGIDRFGFGPIMSIDTGDGSTLTSGFLGVGLASLGMVNLIDVGAGSSLDIATGSFVAMVLPSGSGHIDDIIGYRSVAINFGATTTVDNVYGYKATLPAGAFSTDSWGFYDEGSEYNWFKGDTKIGGTVGTTDRTTTGYEFEVEGDVLLMNTSGAQPTLSLAEDPDNGTNKMVFQAAGTLAADYTLTWPIDDGSSGQFLATDGSGVLSWTTPTIDLATQATGTLGAANGGTGVANNAASTLTISGNFGTTFTVGATTALTLPASGTVTALGPDISLTTEVTGVLPLANGGTNKNLTPINGGVLWTDADSAEVTAAGTSGQILQSNGAAAPSWTTAVGFTNPMDSAGDMIYGGAAGIATKLDSGTSGQILISGGAASPVWTTLLPLANGGTNKAATAVNGGLVWSDADSLEITAAGTASQWVLSGGAGSPTMSNTTTTGKFIDGTANEIQLRVQGFSAQTQPIFRVEDSGATAIFSVYEDSHFEAVGGSSVPNKITNEVVFTGQPQTASTLPTISGDGTSELAIFDEAKQIMRFDGTGAGLVTSLSMTLKNASGAQPVFKLTEDPDNGTNTVAFQSVASLAADYTLTLPVDDGGAGQLLSTDGSGVLSWVTTSVNLATQATGVLPLANGGTNKNATAVNGGLVWSDADSLEITAAGTASDWVLSGGAGTPTMSSTTTTAKTIDGSVVGDVQLTVQLAASQTADGFVVESSAGADLLTVEGNGDVTANTTILVTMPTNNPALFEQQEATITSADVGVRVRFSGNNDATGAYFLKFLDGSSATNEIGSVTAASATGVLFNVASDARLKKDVEPYPHGLADVMAMKPRKFNWKEDGHEDRGFIAQEMKTVFPWAVSGVDDGKELAEAGSLMSMDYGRITPALVAAIQELKHENDDLRKRLEALEAK